MPSCRTRGGHSVLTQISGQLFRSFFIWVFTNWHPEMYNKIACQIIQVTNFLAWVPDEPELLMLNRTWGARRSLGWSCRSRMTQHCAGVEMPFSGTTVWSFELPAHRCCSEQEASSKAMRAAARSRTLVDNHKICQIEPLFRKYLSHG